jgi:hypothetical protein
MSAAMSSADALARARRALQASGRRLMQLGDGGWAVVIGGDRRRRALATLKPNDGRALVDRGEVQPAEGGGYVLVGAPTANDAQAPDLATPGPPMPGPSVFIAAGLLRSRTGGAGFTGLARRAGEGDAALSLRQAQAGLRLIADAERAARTPGLTMDWTATPASRVRRGGRGGGLGAASREAATRIARLKAADAKGFALAWAACVGGASLVSLERRFNLAKRSAAGKLAEALEMIAAGYDAG